MVFLRNTAELGRTWGGVATAAGWVASLTAFLIAMANPVSGGVMRSVINPTEAYFGGTPPVAALMGICSGIAVGALVWLILALSSTLLPPSSSSAVADVRQKINDSIGLLSITALCLVAGVALIALLFRWSSTLVPTGDGADLLVHASSTLSVTAGCTYTFALVLLFVPAGAIHDSWRDSLAEHTAITEAGFDRSKWERNYGLDRSASQVVIAIGSLVAPLLAGGMLASIFGR